MKKTKRFDVKKLTYIGVLGAVSIVLGLTPLGFIPVGPTRATIMHIPVIIGAIMEGPLVGALVGFIFGLFSIFQAVTNPTPVSFVFRNPLIAIIPRVLIGLSSYYSYKFVKGLGDRKVKIGINLIWTGIIVYLIYGIYKNIIEFQGWLVLAVNILLLLITMIIAYFTAVKIKDKSLDLIIPTIVGSLTNTLGVLGLVYILYAEKFVTRLGLSTENTIRTILGIGFTNGIPEIIIGIIIVGSVVEILKRKK